MRLRCARPFRERRKLLQKIDVPLAESRGLGGKNFENSVDPAPPLDRQNRNRSQTEAPAYLHIDERIILNISAMPNFTSPQTLAGDTGVGAQTRTNRRSNIATARAAQHCAFLPHRERRAGSARQHSSGVRDNRQHRIQTVAAAGNQFLQGFESRILIKIAIQACRSLQRSVASTRVERFPGAKWLGITYNHSFFSIEKLPDKTGGTQAARAIWPKYDSTSRDCQGKSPRRRITALSFHVPPVYVRSPAILLHQSN
jgi:hypothetical protein